MLYDRIDHIILGVASLEQAAEPFTRLGLTLSPPTRHAGRGTENRAFFVGGPTSEFYVELLAIADVDEARAGPGEGLIQDVARGGLVGLALSVPDIDGALAALRADGVERRAVEVFADDGRKVCDTAEIAAADRAMANVRLLHYPEAGPARHARHSAAGLLEHRFPLKRLDHLAAIAPDLEAATSYWTDTLGVPVAGELRAPAMIVRQLRIGDAVLELLGPETPDSPLATRPPGLISMAAFEVADLDAAVAQACAAGFTASDPDTGVIPGTRVARIPPSELSGLAMQLLQYV